MGDGVQFRSPYNYDLEAASNDVAIAPGGPSLTSQAMSEDTDLNVMLKRFGVIDKMPTSVRLPTFGDFSNVTDFRSAMDAVLEAENNFMELPADVRARFENNPQRLLDFVENPGNIEHVKKLFGEANVRPGPVGSNAPATATAGTPAGNSTPSGTGGSGGNVAG